VEVVEVGVDSAGRLDMEQLKKTVDVKTALVSIMWANNETGTIFPVEEISAICRAREVPFHCDGTQAMGRLPVDVKKAGMDAMSFSGHKFHGPKGVGGLFIRRGLFLQPLILGGTQENSRRGGTENVAGIVGLGRAAELAVSSLLEMDRVGNLRNRLERGVLARIPGAVINAGGGPRVANTSNIAFARLEADAIVLLLSERGLCVSAGAACSSGSLEPSRVLLNMGINRPLAHGSIRFSLSRYTTAEEIDLAIEMVARAVERLGKILPG
jgi:cysteine desulfurase